MFMHNAGELVVVDTTAASRIYKDSGTGARVDLAVFQVHLPPGYYMTGHYAQRNHHSSVDGRLYIVRPLTHDAIHRPSGFTQKWNDRGSGGRQDVSFWRVVCPSGYVAIGDVIHANSYATPYYLLDKYACIKSSLTSNARSGGQLWTDRGSGARQDGSLFRVQPSSGIHTGYFKAQRGYSSPPDYDFHWFQSPYENYFA